MNCIPWSYETVIWGSFPHIYSHNPFDFYYIWTKVKIPNFLLKTYLEAIKKLKIISYQFPVICGNHSVLGQASL